ncbi:Polyisoprenoid-binding protein YceI [Dokdonella immobilis]|uniref:Polyisoprenoid-binding protein YceI n=2 Tax=Dokdonella immobilis TaxID=578942 RepID=A0A1I4ZS40_9GAMM|nr:Polyisoprenoid-binding protein YceI [Dokdonella immobilis]
MVAALFLPGCLIAMMTLATTAPGAEPPRMETLQFDSKRSSAQFSVKVFWMIPVDGQFGGLRGEVVVDHFSSQARVDARIDADGVTMRRSAYENWVKSAEFFDVERYPEIRFHSDSFPISRLHGGGDLPGVLTMRGIEQSVLFQVQPSTCDRPAIDCDVMADGTVRRSEFGMTTRRASLSDKVELSFSVRIVAPAARAPEPMTRPPQ